jgi:hypothetical protein
MKIKNIGKHSLDVKGAVVGVVDTLPPFCRQQQLLVLLLIPTVSAVSSAMWRWLSNHRGEAPVVVVIDII